MLHGSGAAGVAVPAPYTCVRNVTRTYMTYFYVYIYIYILHVHCIFIANSCKFVLFRCVVGVTPDFDFLSTSAHCATHTRRF